MGVEEDADPLNSTSTQQNVSIEHPFFFLLHGARVEFISFLVTITFIMEYLAFFFFGCSLDSTAHLIPAIDSRLLLSC